MCETVSTLIFTGILARHPKLRFVLVECGIGWIPLLVERVDQTVNGPLLDEVDPDGEAEHPGTGRGTPPSSRDLAGVAERHGAGLHNIMWSTDYPHSDSTWPKSREVLEAHFKDIPADERTLIAGANPGRALRSQLGAAETMSDVLAGIRVVEVADWGFVPSAATVLGDWGAEVVKIEHPRYGDPIRGLVTSGVIRAPRAATSSSSISGATSAASASISGTRTAARSSIA